MISHNQFYPNAHKAFMGAAERNSAIRTYHYPHAREDDFQVSAFRHPVEITVATYGRKDAPNVIVTTTGAHGAELLSFLQRDFLLNADEITRKYNDDVKVVHIHATNPVGSTLVTRTDENFVDINRNFLSSFSQVPPTPAGYEGIAAALVPSDLSVVQNIRSWSRLFAFYARKGTQGFYDLGAGQYQYENGISYGGREPSWTHRTLKSIAHQHCCDAKRVIHIDYHTGLPDGILHGYRPEDKNASCVKDLWSNSWPDIKIESMFNTGDITSFWDTLKLANKPKVTAITVEFGTLTSKLGLLKILRKRHHYRTKGDSFSGIERVKQEMLESFCPSDIRWREKVIEKGMSLLTCAIDGLARAA